MMHNFFLIQGVYKSSDSKDDHAYLENFDGILGLAP
jgi:hypothetical protein